jgi:phage-related protein
MARHLSVESVIDKNRLTSDNAWVILLAIDVVDPNSRAVTETMYIARNDENIVFNGVTYLAGNFEINIDQKQGSSPNVTITAQDQSGYIEARMEASAGAVLSEVDVILVNTARLDKPAEMQERFQITTSSAKDHVVSFAIGAENPLGIQFPKHRQWQDGCAWRFKGYGCGYIGEATVCSYSKDGPNGCSEKSNTINFRALPGLVKMNI